MATPTTPEQRRLLQQSQRGNKMPAIPLNSQPRQTVPPPVAQTDLRFNPVYADAFRNLDRQMVNTQTGAQSQINALSEGRDRGVYDTEEMARAARRALQQRMADQGTLRSGVHVGARSDLNSDTIRAIDDLNQRFNSGVRGVNQNLAQYMADLNAQREGLRMNQTRDEIQTRLAEEERRATAAAQLQYVQILQQLMNSRQLGNQPAGPRGIGLGDDIDPRVPRANNVFRQVAASKPSYMRNSGRRP